MQVDLSAFFAGARPQKAAPRKAKPKGPARDPEVIRGEDLERLREQVQAMQIGLDLRPVGPLLPEDQERYAALFDAHREARIRLARWEDLPMVPQVGPVPKGPEGPVCRHCGGRGKLSRAVAQLPGGEEARLCVTCWEQVQADRERRCVPCGAHLDQWEQSGVCGRCFARGVERVENLKLIRERGWAWIVGDPRP